MTTTSAARPYPNEDDSSPNSGKMFTAGPTMLAILPEKRNFVP